MMDGRAGRRDEFEVLREQFVRGEIDADEYARRLERLPGRVVREGLDRSSRQPSGQGAPFAVTPRSAPPAIRSRKPAPWYVPVAGGCLMLFAGVAVLGAAASGVVGSFAANTQVAYATPVAQNFDVRGAPNVIVRGDTGDVTVRTGDVGEVVVETSGQARRFGPGGSEDRGRWSGASVDQERDTITIVADAEYRDGPPWLDSQSSDVEITVPADTNLEVEVASGDVDVRDVRGDVSVSTESGDVDLVDVTLARSSSVATESGSVTIAGQTAPGTNLDVTAESGDVDLELPRDTDALLRATTESGTLELASWPVLQPESVDGEELQSITKNLNPDPSGTIRVAVESGDIQLTGRE